MDGAQAGMAMLAAPRVGDGYQQESAPGRAEDQTEVLSTDEALNGEFDSYTEVLLTGDSSPLEPRLLERRYYAPDIGLVLQQTVLGGSDRMELVSYEGG